jgi:hypothetical protein
VAKALAGAGFASRFSYNASRGEARSRAAADVAAAGRRAPSFVQI